MSSIHHIELKEHRITTTDGITLAAYSGGNTKGVPLVFVHGFPDNHRIWLPLLKYFAVDFHVMTYDVRGTGVSDKPDSVSAYKLPQLAEDLWVVTKTVLGDKPFHLIGHDWGSIQAWEATCQVRFAARMLSFTTMSGPCLDHVSFAIRDWRRKPLPKLKQTFSSWYVYMFHVTPLANALWKRAAPSWHKQFGIEKNPTQYSDGLNGMKLYRANMIEKATRPEKKRPICPVHLIVLTEDKHVTQILFDGLQRWVGELSVSRLPLAHWAMQEDPEQVEACMRLFFDKFTS